VTATYSYAQNISLSYTRSLLSPPSPHSLASSHAWTGECESLNFQGLAALFFPFVAKLSKVRCIVISTSQIERFLLLALRGDRLRVRGLLLHGSSLNLHM